MNTIDTWRIVDEWPDVRSTRHAHKDFKTWELTAEWDAYSKEVWRRDYANKKIALKISSSKWRVKNTISNINDNSWTPLNGEVETRNYLWLDWMNKDFLKEFDARFNAYMNDLQYLDSLEPRIAQEWIIDEDNIKNRKSEITQNLVAQEYLEGKFDIDDKVAAWIYLRKISQFMELYKRWRFDKNDLPATVLAGTHQTVNESVFRWIFGNNIPKPRMTPVDYAERVSYKPVTGENEKWDKKVFLRIEFRNHVEFVDSNQFAL